MNKKLLRFILLFVIVVLVLLAYFGNSYYKGFLISNVDTKGEKVYLFIQNNASAHDVFKSLKDLEVLIDSNSYQWLAKKKNYQGGNVVPGKYEITDGLTNNQLINHLRAGNGRLDVIIRFNQLRNLKELAGALTREVTADSTDAYRWLTNRDSVRRFGFNRETIISMFIPNTYFVNYVMTVPQIMRRMAKEYKSFWNSERIAKANACGLSQSEVVTMASIVYWETKLKKDMPIVAGVYMNRIRIGMPLQADPTLLFVLGDTTIKRVLSVHKEIDSPYNTYKNKGLPPGPIIIPPIVYIDAVLNYDKNDYLYFVAKEDLSGESYFSKSYRQHLVYAKRYQRALNQRKVFR